MHIQPVSLRKFIPYSLILTPILAGTANSCARIPDFDESKPMNIEFPDIPKPKYDSATTAKLDSLLAVKAYKADSIKNSSNNQAELDSLYNAAGQAAQNIVNSAK